MSNLSLQQEYEAKMNLERGLRDIMWRHTIIGSAQAELFFQGVNNPESSVRDYLSDIESIIRYIEDAEAKCDNDLHIHCREFLDAIGSSSTASWDDRNLPQHEEASKIISGSIDDVDRFIDRCKREVAEDFKNLQSFSGFSLYDLQRNGIGRPWGTAFRRRIASACGLKNEVDSLYDMGLNSVAHSKHVYMGDHFLELIRKDPAMSRVRKKVEEVVVRDIKSKVYNPSNIEIRRLDDVRISDSSEAQFGGDRSAAPMFEQLGFTLQHPIQSTERYPETWNAAMNELTWSIRSCTVNFSGVYHAVYNAYGFAYVWEVEFSFEDIFDLRPSTGLKIDFSGGNRNTAYNVVTSVLGSLYHDVFGNSDNMRTRCNWSEFSEGEIRQW